MSVPPDTSLAGLDWVPRNRTAALKRLGLTNLSDLLAHYPRRHEDRRRFDRFPDGEMDRPVCLFGVATKTALKRFGGRRGVVEITVEDESAGVLSQPVLCRWFNMPYILKAVTTGDKLVVFGRPKMRGRQVVIDHPEYEVVAEDEDTSIHMNRIAPVHPAGEGVTTRLLRLLINRALREVEERSLVSLNPADPRPLLSSLRALHFPKDFDELNAARQDLIREEFFSLQVLIQARRSEWQRIQGVARISQGHLLAQLLGSLPFTPTASQHEVIAEIRRDLAQPSRMNRLLQGDVGSGKTLVALAAMLLCVEAGGRAALMAPTQILAEQHYLNFHRLLAPLGLSVALRSAGRKTGRTDEADDLLPLPQNGAASIIVGTHALLYESADLKDLGLVVIDEQHKFGVLQRAKLIDCSGRPDVLVMTATPIPRTLTQTFYGDLDVSVLREKPANRGAVQTAVREAGKLPEVVDFLRKQIEKGRQAYIVYPLVEESDKLAAKSALAEFEKWKPLLAPHSAGVIHGRLSPEEKESVMTRFRSGELSVLVATTVIEVGVDVANANLMVVENAERFGLAQLHQLRGRIGRGTHKSYCILLHDPKAEAPAVEKLAVLEKTSDGFEVAEADLRLRGPGDLVGTAQTGLPPLRLGDLFQDAEIMRETGAAAAAVFARDPELRRPEHARIKIHLDQARANFTALSG